MKALIAVVVAGLLIAGCSSKDTSSQSRSSSAGAGGLVITTAFSPDPPRKGADSLTVMLKDSTGAAVKGATVKIITTMPTMSMTGPSAIARDNGDGTYTAHVSLQYATSWQFGVSATAPGKKGVAQLTADVK